MCHWINSSRPKTLSQGKYLRGDSWDPRADFEIFAIYIIIFNDILSVLSYSIDYYPLSSKRPFKGTPQALKIDYMLNDNNLNGYISI